MQTQSRNIRRPEGKTPGILENTGRRGALLGGAAAAIMAIAPAQAGNAGPAAVKVLSKPYGPDDAAIIRLAADLLASSDACAALGVLGDAAMDRGDALAAKAAYARQREIAGQEWPARIRLATLRAVSLPALRAKAAIARRFSQCKDGFAAPDDYQAVAWSLANDVLGIPSLWAPDDSDDEQGAEVAPAGLDLPASFAAPQAPDHQIITMCAEFDAIERQIRAVSKGELGADEQARDRIKAPLEAEQEWLAGLISTVPACTLEGHAARARTLVGYAAHLLIPSADACPQERILVALLRDLAVGEV